MSKMQPPQWADRFLEWYCRPDLLEEIQGDIHELYRRQAAEKRSLADIRFVWNVVRFLRLRNIRRRNLINRPNTATMFANYLVIGFRNALRNGISSLINVSGLALGVAGAITIFIFADQFFHVDNFHEKRERIYEVVNVITRDQQAVMQSDVPILLGPALQQDIAVVEKAVRIEIGSGSVRHQESVFSETLYFTDSSFFDVFSFPFVEGSAKSFAEKSSLILTHQAAQKYFGSVPATGKVLSIKFSDNSTKDFTVAGVIDLPENNTLYFDFLLPMDTFLDLGLKDTETWSYLTDATFVLLKEGRTISEFTPFLSNYVKLQNQSNPEWLTQEFKVFPITNLSEGGAEIESNLMGAGHPQGVWAMATIASMLLLLACFNYMNISLATITTRLKEIGVRKVIGSNRKQIIYQFVTENFVQCAAAIGLGLAISYFVLMPGLNSIISFKIPFAFSSGQSMVFFFAGIVFFVVAISGVYPAVYISRFTPTAILKGKERFGQRSKFSRVLLTVQFILAFTTIVGSFVFIDNSLYLKNKDWGYDHDQNLVVPVTTFEQYLALRDQLTTQKNVISQSGSANHIGYWNTRSSVLQNGERFEIVDYQIGFGYLETMNLRMMAGRSFDRSIQSDQLESVIINENFVKTMGWTNAIDQVFEYEQLKRRVIGVVKNFHYDDFYRDILPVVIRIVPETDFRYVSVKVEAGTLPATEAWLKETWKKIAPDDPYEGIPQEEVFANFKNNNKTDIKILSFVAAVALILACLGLFGLVSYNTTRRLKEFSIRKVYGANLFHIFKLMNRDYVWILGISFGIGAPTGFFMMDYLIQHIYADPQSAGPGPFLLAVGLMVATVMITLTSQFGRITRENPAKTLRLE